MKKLISIILCVAIVLSFSTIAAADNKANTTYVAQNGIQYVETRNNNTLTISTINNGVLLNEAIYELGSNIITLYDYTSTNTRSLYQESPTQLIYNISDLITQSEPNIIYNYNTTRAGSSTTGYLGRITYTAVESGASITRYLGFTSSLVSSTTSSFNVAGAQGTAFSVLVTAVIAGFSSYCTSALASALLTAAGCATSAYLPSAFSTTINGTVYQYNVTATSLMGGDTRTFTKAGDSYYGTYKKNGVNVYGPIFTGHYPEFISERDNMVAIWFYDYFWSSSARSVRSWS